ncbi:MAG: hypothetical protein ACT4O4_08330, partial [Nitrospiraceae bacterium]
LGARWAPVQVVVAVVAGWPETRLSSQAEAPTRQEQPVSEAQAVPLLQSELVESAMAPSRVWRRSGAPAYATGPG